MCKVSIIVPIYDVSNYLRKCLDSVLNQTLKEIEIILVNDASPNPKDEEICLEYEELDERIVYTKHSTNKGLGGARNTGIHLAKADYVMHIDSDDWIHPKMAAILYNAAIKENACIVECNFQKIFNNGDTENTILHTAMYPGDKINYLSMQTWNKIYKKKIFIKNNIFFPEKITSQDTATTPRLALVADKFIKIKDVLYYHIIEREGALTTNFEKKLNDLPIVFNIVKDFMLDNNFWNKYRYSYYNKIWGTTKYNIEKIIATESMNEVEKLELLNKKLIPILYIMDINHEEIFCNNVQELLKYLKRHIGENINFYSCLLYTSPSPRDA